MKRIWMLLALLLLVLLVCSACQASTEEILAQMEAAATQGDFEAVRTLIQKNHKVLSLSEKKGLPNYYKAREHEYRDEDAVAWYLYTAKTPGFMDSDARAKALKEKIGSKGHLFNVYYESSLIESIPSNNAYHYFLYGDTLFHIETPPYAPQLVNFGERCVLVAPDGTLLTTPEWTKLSTSGNHYTGTSAKTGKSCLLDSNGQIVAIAPWGTIYRYSVEDRILTLKSSDKYGLADFDGNVLCEAVWTDIRPFSDGYAAVKDTHWGIIDKSGKLVVDTRFDTLSDPLSGYAIASIRRDHETYTNVIDMSGNVVNDYPWSDNTPTFINGAAKVYSDKLKLSYLINPRGDILSGGWASISRSRDGVSVVGKRVDFSDKYGLIDDAGRVILEPCMRKIGDFSDGYAAFYGDNGYGFLDVNGHTVIRNQWDYAFAFEEGYAEVNKGDYNGLIDTKGQLVLATAYDYIYRAGDSVYLFKKGEKWGAIHLAINKKLPCEYDDLNYLGEGFFEGEKLDVWGEKSREIIDISTGQKFSSPGWIDVSNAFGGKILIKSDEQFILLDCQTGQQEALAQPIRISY